ncbi:MAG TPA: polysulfide reductase NrfD [Candidatus Aveggerthella stercoripullorum]|uniref:Polysulfide reductase NrfD n=1 Tax=Candidatus Aveggerthella stercoripullorum TaxID=2840688 RepID=A0A9D1D3C5_9ACTN|nr:polysulfide reductase NrfD [Candidatus Aveggerthella stercoripullorum]
MYGPLIIAYLFFGGAAAGALFVVCAWSIFFRRTPQPERLADAFATLRRRILGTGVVLLAFAMMCLLWDLGNPERALLVFLHPHPTAITFGAYSLAACAFLAATLFAERFFGKPALRGRARLALELLCCAASLAVMSYTGVFLLQGAIPLWQHWSIVGLFTFSSLSAGVSIVMLIDWFTQGNRLLLRSVKPLQRLHLLCLACETAFLALFVWAACANPNAQNAIALLAAPDMLATAIIGACGMGIALPASMEGYALARTECRTIPVADMLCLTGCLTLRYCVITCGVY